MLTVGRLSMRLTGNEAEARVLSSVERLQQ
jgi:hypothetical protein